MKKENYITLANKAANVQINELKKVKKTFNTSFIKAVDLILNCKGKVIFAGIGKSGLIARKISATFSSVGIPSFFCHPSEALHGDMGQIEKKDLLVIFSYSGNTSELSNMIKYANGMVKHLPIDKNTSDVLTPLFDMTSQHYAMRQMGATQMNAQQLGQTPQQRRMMQSGTKPRSKRSVSETKKKFVAAEQNWTCALCKKKLPAWFEVDHTISLENGGTNHVSNLRALCRDCHGHKTAMENL